MKILFQPASQITNAGDQLINLLTLTAVRRYGEIVIDDLRTPEWFIEGIGAKSDGRFSRYGKPRFYTGLMAILLSNLAKGTREKFVLVLPPGHSSRKGLSAALGALVWYAKLGILRLLGCPVVRVGFSIGPFDPLNAVVESLGTRCFSYYGLRDRESIGLAKRHKFANVLYFPDLAWSYQTPVSSEKPDDGGHVVLSFRANAYGDRHDPEYFRPICQRVAHLLEHPELSTRKIHVCFQVESDREASVQLSEHLREAGFDVALNDQRLSIDAAAALYANAYCVLSNRLHVLLLAARSGSLPIPLANYRDNAKITSILRDNDLSGIVLNIEEGLQSNAERLGSILQAKPELVSAIAGASERNQREIETGFQRIFEGVDWTSRSTVQ